MKAPAVDIVVFALKERLRAFYTGGALQAFGGEDPLVVLFGALKSMDVGSAVEIVTDCPPENRERWLASAATQSLPVRIHSFAGKGMSAALAALPGFLLKIASKNAPVLLIEASAPLTEADTLRKLLRGLRDHSVVSSATRAAVALSRSAFVDASALVPGVRARSLADWLGFLEKDARFTPSMITSTAGAAYEGSLDTVERVYAAVAERRLHTVFLHVARGLGVADPRTLDLRGTLKFGRNVTIAANVQLIGDVVLGDNVTVGPNCLIENARIGAGCAIKEFTTVSGARIGERSRIGPYARVRPDSRLGAACQIGNFVEIKASKLGPGCKINHHSFIGDATLAKDVIIGAGSITCNYDGAKSQRTKIGRGAFVGSGVMMIAPITIGRGAFVAAGSTVTKRAPAGGLTIARARQAFVANWRK